MEIWLKNNENDMLLIPVNPSSIGSEVSNNFEDIVFADGNERTVIGGKALRNYTIQSFVPHQDAYYVKKYKFFASPTYFVNKINGWLDNNSVLLFQATETVINEKVTIRNFNWEEIAGTGGDIEYTLELKQYATISTQEKITSVVPPAKVRPSSNNKVVTKFHTVKQNESLWIIAKKYYGQGSSWSKIYEANKMVIGANPNLLKPGQTLVIP